MSFESAEREGMCVARRVFVKEEEEGEGEESDSFEREGTRAQTSWAIGTIGLGAAHGNFFLPRENAGGEVDGIVATHREIFPSSLLSFPSRCH